MAVLLTKDNYISTVLDLIKNSKKTVYVYMYLLHFSKSDLSDPVYKLLNALIDASNRNVSVRVILENSKWGNNKKASYYLSQAGVFVCNDTLSTFMHQKTIIIDDRIVIIGSHNWTPASLSENWETSILVDSYETAAKVLQMNKLLPIAAYKPPSPTSSIAVPRRFFYKIEKEKKIPGALGKFIEARSSVDLDLYLALCRLWPTGSDFFSIQHKKLLDFLGLDKNSIFPNPWHPFDYNNECKITIKRSLKRLEKTYNLIKQKKDKIKILDLGSAKRNIFYLPKTYWNLGWTTRLSLRAKTVYLIHLNQSQISRDFPWWSLAQSVLNKWYGVRSKTFGLGVIELKNWNLIEVKQGINPAGKSYNDRDANKYCYKEFYNMDDYTKRFNEILDENKKQNVIEAEKIITSLDEAHDLEKLHFILSCIETYSLSAVKKAFEKVKPMRRSNPLRSTWMISNHLKENTI